MVQTSINIGNASIIGVERNGIRIFRGITYATCERFSEAVKCGFGDGVTMATDHGTVTPQRSCRLASVIGEEKGSIVDENRLCLSIYTPAGAKDLPVMVWIHGGSYVTGGSEEKRYSGERLVETGNLVVVKISYRLGVFGYLWKPEEGIGNLGLKDQTTALEWIQENISAFGGDPSKVTLFGQSAGGHSVASLIATVGNRGLFSQAILQSPPLGMSLSEKAATKNCRKFTRLLGKDPREASLDELLDVQERMCRSKATMPFMPVIPDCTDVPSGTNIRVVAGYATEDVSPFLRKALGPLMPTAFGRSILHWATGNVFRKPAEKYVAKLNDHGLCASLYRISWAPKDSPLGACHCIEMPFILGFFEDWKDALMLKGITREEYDRISEIFLRTWTGFANGTDFTQLP